MNSPLQQLDPNQRYSIEEATALLRTSRARLYEKVKLGEIVLIKDGRRTYVPGSEILRISSVSGSAQR